MKEREYGTDKKKQTGRVNEWFRCPHCGKALFPIKPDTKIQHLSYRCKACKHDIEVNI